MPFFIVFYKTLGFLVGFTLFIVILSIFFNLLTKDGDNFRHTKGDVESENIIATIDLNGPIIDNFNKSLTGSIISFIDPENVKNQLIKVEKIKAKILIIKINSPGGTVTATSKLENIIKSFKNKNKTKVLIYSNEILTSGGYWIATSADKIFASYGSIIGSIGVSGPRWYYYDSPISISSGILGQKIETKNKIQIFNQSAGTSKDLYNPFRKPTNSELTHLKNIVKDIYNDFLIKVAKSRNIEIDILKKDIGALIFTSNQAKNNFLIDDVLNFEELIKKILITNEFNDYKLLELNSKKSLLNMYLANYFFSTSISLCDKLNSNFISMSPLYLNNC